MKAYLDIAALSGSAATPATAVSAQPAEPLPAAPGVIRPRHALVATPPAAASVAAAASAQTQITAAAPITDQADGLRKLFTQPAPQSLALMANPFVVWSGVALERLALQCRALGHEVLVVDAADTSPAAPESAALGLAGCIDRLPGGAYYLAARGLPRSRVDPRGSAAGWLDELAQACPQASVILVHAEMTDLARIFKGQTLRPMLMAADHVESLKHAYAGWKLLAQRCAWLTADLLQLAPANSSRNRAVAASLASTADRYFGGLLVASAVLDPMDSDNPQLADALRPLLLNQLGPSGNSGNSGNAGNAGHFAAPGFSGQSPTAQAAQAVQRPSAVSASLVQGWQTRPAPSAGLWA